MLKNKKGFTIVELVIVIAVIAILAAVLIPTFTNVISKADQSAVMQAGRAKFEEVYALDMADGTVDGRDDTATTNNTLTTASTLTALGFDNCTYTVDATNHKVTKFEYTDSTKGYKATYNGTKWTVGATS